MANKQLYWQKIRGGTILSVILIYCQAGTDGALDTLNGVSYFLLRNLVNFPVAMFFFISGFFLKPIDNSGEFYKRRLPRLIIPYLFYTFVYLGMGMITGGVEINIKRVVMALLLGTASTPLYYIVVLIYFTLLSPFLLKAVNSKKLSVLLLLSTPGFLLFAFGLRFVGIDIWGYLKYTPVWLSFYYLGMIIKAHKPSLKKSLLWILLPVALISELLSTLLLSNLDGFNAYTQLRFAGAFYSIVLILLTYEYSKDRDNSEGQKILVAIGNDSYAIYYMHCAFLMIFSKVIKYEDSTTFLPLYQFGEMVFAVIMCELIISVLKRIIKAPKIQMIFGV